MTAQEWDWPPTRRHYRRYRTRFDVYQPDDDEKDTVGIFDGIQNGPSGWNSPITKRAVDIYWRVMVAIIKMLIILYLTVMAFCGSWLFWTALLMLR